jgi:hypothetical protein
MTAVKVNLPVIEVGADYHHNFYWMEQDKVTPINLTNFTAKMQIRSVAESPVVLLELSTDNGRIIISPVLGQIALNVSNIVTNSLAPIKDAVYDLELYNVDGRAIRLVEGKVTIKIGVTR